MTTVAANSFHCNTCDLTQDAQEMMKHLSSSRHKTISCVSTGEDLSCEECSDLNIHQLQLIRFGGEDMSLLCNSCFSKDYSGVDKPSTLYTLSNGSILKNWNNYCRVRDCCCKKCGSERNLNVNDKKIVLCDSCLSQTPSAKGFTSEKEGRFLYVLLGIKETSTEKANGRNLKTHRKLGRGMKGRGVKSKTPRAKKPLTHMEQMAKKAYETKKLNSIIESDTSLSLRSFKGFKAATSSGPVKEERSSTRNHAGMKSSGGKQAVSRKDGNKVPPVKGGKGKGTINKSTKSNEPVNPRSKGSANANSKASSSNVKKYTAKAGQNDHSSDTRKQKLKPAGREPPSFKQPKSNNLAHNQSKPKSPLSKTESSPRNQSKNPVHDDSKPATKISKQTRTGKGKDTKSNAKDSGSGGPFVAKGSKPKGPKIKNSETNGRNGKESEAKNGKGKPLNGKNTTSGSESTVSPDSVQGEIEEGEPLTKFTKYVAKTTYPDLNTYFNEFSFALFLEQRLENDFMQDFQISWPKDPREGAFVVDMKQNNPELEKLLSPMLVKLGRMPFTKQQPLMLTTQDETQVWYTYVKEIASQRGKITILLELYPWNTLGLPVNKANDAFKILPCSAQVNRIMFAMTRVKNPRFINMLLGHEPIKQIYFKNRLNFTKDTFNESQKSAIQHVLNNSITILQGPPGTGKTSTIEEIILQLIENFHTFPILCVAASNIAIDNIAEKFMVNKPNIKILRILSQGKEQQYNSSHPLGKICLHNIVYDNLSFDMKDNLSKLRSGVSGSISKNQYNKLLTEQNNIADRYISQAQIIFTTNIASGGRQLKAIQELPIVIMDESTQSSEASTLVPLSLPGIKRFVFVGDEKQLSSFSNVPQLEMSLFERVLLNGTYTKPHMLDTQYRMHPTISEFPIKRFYDGKLQDGVTAEDKSWPGVKYPLYFYHCDKGLETKVFNRKRGMMGFTYNNKFEAQDILAVLHKLIVEKNVPRDEIGVITPYSAQRDLVSDFLVKDSIVNPEGNAMEQEIDKDDIIGDSSTSSEGNKSTINIINGVYVATVDSFQGHEKRFIIFSCVRNNKENKIGFVKDRRRLNVALTRAKNGLVLVGNKEVMKSGDDLWQEYIDYLENKELIFDDLSEY